MQKSEKTYNSANSIGTQSIQLAHGFISLTRISFEEEKIFAEIEAKNGHIDFLDCNGTLLASADISSQTGGTETYDNVFCLAKDGIITLDFPIVEWIDNYPHCDGEHDRWDSRTIGYHTVSYNTETKEISTT